MTTPNAPVPPSPRYEYTPAPAAPKRPRTPSWWLPLAAIVGVVLLLLIGASLLRECGPVDRTVYPTEEQQEAAVARGDTIPAADPRAGTSVSVHACTWRP